MVMHHVAYIEYNSWNNNGIIYFTNSNHGNMYKSNQISSI